MKSRRAGGRADLEKGFTLVEVLVAVALVLVCLVGSAQFYVSAGDRIMDSETRSLLHQVASREIENIRALRYENVGTVHGQPRGALLDVESTTVEGVPLEIAREVVYVQDDSYSGPYPANYRRVTVTVRATGSDELDPMQLSTIVAGGADGGTLDVTVTNLAGAPIPGARLRIDNDHLVPWVHIDAPAIRTDSEGHLLIPGLAPDDTNSYYVTATKTGYNSAATPEGLVVTKGTPFAVVQLVIDQLSTLTIHVTDGNGAPRPGVALRLTGHLSVEPWTYSEEVLTDSNGHATLTNIRYSTSLQPYLLQTSVGCDPPLSLPDGVDPDPVDQGITLQPGQVGLILDPGISRTVELTLQNP